MAEKIYVGSGWEKTFSNGGSVINISIKQSKIAGLVPNDYGDVKLVVAKRKEPDPKSNATHYVAVDTYRQSSGPVEDPNSLPL